MKYYLLYLNNNPCNNKTKIKDVILVKDDPFEDVSYEPLEVLAYNSGMFCGSYMIDVLTGKKIYLDNDTITPHITYTFKSEVNEDTLIKIYEKYKKLSKKELERYKKGIESIEKTAISNYNDYIKSIEEKREKYNNACIYINELVENNTF